MDRRNPRVAELLNLAAAAQREANVVCAHSVALVRERHCKGGARDRVVRRCYPALPSSVPLARAATVRLAIQTGASPARLNAIRLAVSEAMTNAVVHAYPSTTGAIHVTAAVTDGELTVLIADDGIGPRTRPRRPGKGWGWPLISRVSDRFVISQRGFGGTLVEICWDLSVEGEPGAPAAAVTADSSSA